MQHGRMIASKLAPNVRQTEICELPAEIHRHLPRLRGILVFQRPAQYLLFDRIEPADL